MFGIIYMLAATVFFIFPTALSIAAGVSFFVVACVAMLLMVPTSPSFRFAFGSLYGSCFAFSVYVNWRLNVERYKGFLNALQAEIRQTEVLEQGKELLRLSNTDALTGLENRRSIDARLRALWDAHQTAGTKFAVLLLDIDFFKRFNDGYGHQEGDRCLVLVADAIAVSAATFGGSTGRYGGEEFIVLARVKTPDDVPRMAETIRSAVEAIALAHVHRRDGMDRVTVSVGATVTRANGGSKLDKMVQEADRALYGAKANGRNCVRLFDAGGTQTVDDSENIAALLKIAIAQDLVSLVYQPIRAIASGRIEGVETLMRLRTLDGTLVPPSEFIPVAKRTGVIAELGLWTIRTVCRDLLVGERVPIASINLSTSQLQMPGFANAVAAILSEAGVAAHRLAFEITEGREIETHADVCLCLVQLKQLGVRLWLNDFSNGFAGLSWLRLIDFDIVKIDRSFLQYDSDAEGRAAMHDIVGLIRNRGHEVLVQGIETPEQLSFMQGAGIDHVQGFHVGRPAPAADYRAA
ncbi:MAG: GGDEF domain-containing protein [Beijerinckiaceae bacterium]|nr:GGDEF domain-containing protein [Beijerinckiaceae bacterium]